LVQRKAAVRRRPVPPADRRAGPADL